MAVKAKKEAKVEQKAEKKAVKGGKTAASAKSAAPAELPVDGAPQVDLEELEEQQDEAASAAGQAGSAAAALAAAAGSPTEMSASFKNFRHHPDMENFYRFIYENDLRHEAMAIIDQLMLQSHERKQIRAARAQAH